jgi:hypothetical protein
MAKLADESSKGDARLSGKDGKPLLWSQFKALQYPLIPSKRLACIYGIVAD